ncbi:hypothetical protein [Prosthecobacter sp.]|jgi:hypothetical protein|uniref:hypothetical protein n=1 Tax=Prosthecobacter sp. TaxID=1965333 RepID=UPI0037CA5152
MSWFQLDPPSIAKRARAAGSPVPTLWASLKRGMIGFTVVSVAGFVPWAVFGQWFHKQGGEAGMYAACAVVFLVLTAPLLHRLIIGPGSMSRFYKVFCPAFAAYSVAWIAGWMMLRGHLGSIAGLISGTVVMACMLVAAFDALRVVVKVFFALFVLNAIGYFVGGVSEAAFIKEYPLYAKLSWGVFYGIGLGAGLGLAFHICQGRARKLLAGG